MIRAAAVRARKRVVEGSGMTERLRVLGEKLALCEKDQFAGSSIAARNPYGQSGARAGVFSISDSRV